MQAHDVLTFWFDELTPAQHFAKDAALDRRIRTDFSEVHAAASRGELEAWRADAPGRLAEIIVLDQFSRNLFRDDARAFANDTVALVLAQEMVRLALDQTLAPGRRAFAYMPFMHSESPRIHARAVELFSQPGLEYNLKFERAHKDIIDRFGRYPHRNVVLGRESTAEELAFLKQPGSSF